MSAVRLAALALLLLAQSAVADDDPVRIRATIDPEAHEIRGMAALPFVNRSSVPLSQIVLVAFANRFATADGDGAINDFNRPFVYPYQAFEPGWMKLEQVLNDDQPMASAPWHIDGVPDGVAIALPLAQPLAPGAALDLHVSFVTRLPNRFGSFGYFEDQLTALGGWYPAVAPLQPDGSWSFDRLPALARFDVELHLTRPLDLALNGALSNGPVSAFRATVDNVHYLSLVAAEHLEREEIAGGDRPVVLLYRKPRRWHRLALGPTHAETRHATLSQIAGHVSMPDPPHAPLVIVEAPLRMHLSGDGEGMVVLSDRALRLHWLLRPYHELAVTQAIYAELLRPRLSVREPSGDYRWVSEGLAHALARRYVERASPLKRSVQDWIELFNLFAVVDRFETAPKVPFVEAFFAKQVFDDPLHEQVGTLAYQLPPGWVFFTKLRRVVGDAAMAEIVDGCSWSEQPFRDCAEARHPELAPFFAEWIAPLPRLNYSVQDKDLNRRVDGGFEHRIEVQRESDRLVHEPVTVQLASLCHEPETVRWEGESPAATVVARTDHRVQQVVLDPERELIESTRADNASPPVPQVLLDTAEVEVSSTEFSFAGTVVARGRYDYRKDIALTGFFTNRVFGMTVGPRYHWGTQNDENSYRHNVYGFYTLQALDADFDDKSRPHFHTDGRVGGFGLRYEYNDIFSWDNPTNSTRFRLFTDIYDQVLGSDFDYVDWGASLSLTRPLWSYATLFAFDVFNGFSTALGDSLVPNQGRYSLGGSRSIRGIDAEQELGRNIFVMRAELRQAIYPEVDLNLMDFLILRRGQIHLFTDTGDVDSSSGDIYDPRNFAVGVGAGFGFVYEFMGLYPATMYVEVATRADGGRGQGNVQVLFGTRQAF